MATKHKKRRGGGGRKWTDTDTRTRIRTQKGGRTSASRRPSAPSAVLPSDTGHPSSRLRDDGMQHAEGTRGAAETWHPSAVVCRCPLRWARMPECPRPQAAGPRPLGTLLFFVFRLEGAPCRRKAAAKNDAPTSAGRPHSDRIEISQKEEAKLNDETYPRQQKTLPGFRRVFRRVFRWV